MNDTDREQLEKLMAEYLSDPFNAVNLGISGSVTVGVAVVGAENMVGILAGYLNSTVEALGRQVGKESIEFLIEALVEDLNDIVEGIPEAKEIVDDSWDS